MNIMHSSQSDSWMTPIPILDRVRTVFDGKIDLDPASSIVANERVDAKCFYTKDSNGLERRWFGNVFCNPPGGKLSGKSLTGLFWRKLMQERPHIDQAIFMCFSIEALQSTQLLDVPSIGEFMFCVPRRRIHFDPSGPSLRSAPSHSNAIVYVPGRVDARNKFIDTFSDLGIILGGIGQNDGIRIDKSLWSGEAYYVEGEECRIKSDARG